MVDEECKFDTWPKRTEGVEDLVSLEALMSIFLSSLYSSSESQSNLSTRSSSMF